MGPASQNPYAFLYWLKYLFRSSALITNLKTSAPAATEAKPNINTKSCTGPTAESAPGIIDGNTMRKIKAIPKNIKHKLALFQIFNKASHLRLDVIKAKQIFNASNKFSYFQWSNWSANLQFDHWKLFNIIPQFICDTKDFDTPITRSIKIRRYANLAGNKVPPSTT